MLEGLGMTVAEVLMTEKQSGRSSSTTSTDTLSETVPNGKVWFLSGMAGLNQNRESYFYCQIGQDGVEHRFKTSKLIPVGDVAYLPLNIWVDEAVLVKVRDGNFVTGDSVDKKLQLIEFNRGELIRRAIKRR